MKYNKLKLENQVCFPVYAASRLIIREYQPLLDKLDITYTQYLVLLILWEVKSLSVNEISQKLYLNTNTVTPLLKRLEKQGLVSRIRSHEDERKVIIQLTEKGEERKKEAVKIPAKLSSELISDNITVEELIDLKDKLYNLINFLDNKQIK